MTISRRSRRAVNDWEVRGHGQDSLVDEGACKNEDVLNRGRYGVNASLGDLWGNET